MAELPHAAREPSEILDLAAVPRPMQQRVHIVVQVDWFQIAEKFLPRPDEETDIRDLTVAVMTTEEESTFHIDMTKQIITNYLWAQFQQNLRKREFCLKLVHPHSAEIVSLNWDDTWRETLVAQSIPFNIGLLQLVVYPSLDYTFYLQPVVRLNNPVGNPWFQFTDVMHLPQEAKNGNASLFSLLEDIVTLQHLNFNNGRGQLAIYHSFAVLLW